MLPRDADATRARLIEAATAEFARYGIAGARVDRIAAAARSNKAQIYHYFGSKAGLFAVVMGSYAERAIASDYFDATDLPETAAIIFDDFVAHPELARLVTWYRLEAADLGEATSAIDAANTAKIAAIEKAQADGIVTDRLPAVVLLGLMLTVATSWSDLPPAFAAIGSYGAAQQRQYVVDAVTRLVAP
jgi:AcrR family transcriptional regulator